MRILFLSIFVTAAWLLWAVGGTLALHADKMQGKRPQDAGFSILPIIPLFPLLAVLVAFYTDKVVAPWGSRVVGIVHSLLAVVFLIGIARELHRVRSSRDS